MKYNNEINRYDSNNLKKRYILALSVIAFLVIFSQLIIQNNINKQENDSRVINIAGRQRMLSQRINKAALALYIAEDNDIKKKYLNELVFSVNIFEQSHKGLQNGNAKLGLPGNNSEVIGQLFSKIKPNYESIIEATNIIISMAKEPNFPQKDMYIKILVIRENESIFLKGMDSIVFQYDNEAKAKVEIIKYLEYILMFVTLFVLMLEARYIFMPAEKQIKKTLTDIHENEENLQKLFDIAPAAMFLINPENLSILKLNQKAIEMIGINVYSVIGCKIDSFFENHHTSNIMFFDKLKNGGEITDVEVVLKNSNIKSRVALMSSIRIFFHNKPIIVVGLSDISEQKRSEEVLKHHATMDDMTGLINRRAGILILKKEMERCKTNFNDLIICFIDLDGLKFVNDFYGHNEGDWFIKVVSNVLLEDVRLGDSVFRIGGDEIVIIINDCSLDDAKKILIRVEKNIDKINGESNKPYKVDISYGFAEYKILKPSSVEEFINYADQQMYENKKMKKCKC